MGGRADVVSGISRQHRGEDGTHPAAVVGLAREKGYDDPGVKAGVIVEWLNKEYDLGRGHAMALVHVIKKGPKIDAKHVGSAGTHRDESTMLWLDGKATRSD